jgi:DNA-directed RNA polymerase specialized sigma24 family protein
MEQSEMGRPGEKCRLEGQDPLLHPFLSASNEEAALAELDALFTGIVIPTVQKVLSQKLRMASPIARLESADTRCLDEEDFRQQTLVALTTHLWQLYQNPAEHRISVFPSYVAGAAINTWRDAVRRDAKLWTRLSNRLTYLFRGTAGPTGFGKWQDAEHESLAGFAIWQRKKMPIGHLDLEEAQLELPPQTAALPEVVAWVLEQAGGPLPWNEFVTAIAFVLQVKDERISIEGSKLGPLLGGTSEPDRETSDRVQLRACWDVIRKLDVKERAVLLLKAEDLLDLELSQVATVDNIASVLELPLSRLLELLPRLPLDDQEIAQLLKIQRQTVVNLRRQARSTLRRRLRS